mmetsp:Transcript_1159/g.2563  ORF Transcript_1159/g.2563 Transcript_1159/m.2563 type:complete len:211 (-) Transcript_1159:127-759(-)
MFSLFLLFSLLPHAVDSFSSTLQCKLLDISTLNGRPFSVVGPMMSSEQDDYDLQKIKVGDREFWAQQKELAAELIDASESSLREANREKFAKRRLALVGDTAYIGFIASAVLWSINDNPFVAISFAFGALLGTAYSYGLGKYVEVVGGSIADEATSRGAGVGEARFAFLIILFIVVGKFRSVGLQEIPAISGFFVYQLGTFSQGFREIND